MSDSDSRSLPTDRGHLLTEVRNPRSMSLGSMTTSEAVELMLREDATIPAAVAAVKTDIERAIELVVAAFEAGGRLIYVGAGTSGRLGVLDASECPPTFLSDPRMVQGVIAGGWEALRRSIEGAEDSAEDGAGQMDAMSIDGRDVVFGITSGGTTPYVHGAIRRARERGARTVFFACVPRDQVDDEADVSIRVLVGPEVLTGSTRLKSGTATKLVLNMVTTVSMVRLGKVVENLMVDVNTRANRKLVDRGVRILGTLTGLDRAPALALLEAAEGHVKTALAMHRYGTTLQGAREMLARVHGRIADLPER